MTEINSSEILFYLLGFIPVSSFILYPLIMKVFSSLVNPVNPPEKYNIAEAPEVAVLISSFNEGETVRDRIENLLSQDYPKDKLKIYIHSDGSSDNTDEIVRSYAGCNVFLLSSNINRGKTVCLNDLLNAAKNSEILVYSDANTMFEKDSVNKLIRWMKNDKIGCVCGRLIIADKYSNASEKGEKRYWAWDTKLKTWEGRSGYLLGGNGAIIAIRRSLAAELDGNQSNDMILPIIARLRGYLNIYDPDAAAYEYSAPTVKKELKRKSRIIARGLYGVVFSAQFAFYDKMAKKAQLSQRLFLLFQLFLKKFFRYLLFPAIVIMIPTGFSAGRGIPLLFSAGSSFCIISALLLLLLSRLDNNRRFRIPDVSYPLAVFAAALLGFYMFMSGRDMSKWKKQRE